MATGLSNLKVYTLAEQLELEVHEFAKMFPREERYRSVDQLLRSSSATTSNIAEAYKKQSVKEKVHILQSIVVCEAEETKSNLIRCGKKNLCDPQTANDTAERYHGLIKAVQGYIRFLKATARKTEELTNR